MKKTDLTRGSLCQLLCAGNYQSPINLDLSNVVRDKNLMPINFFNYNKSVLYNIANNGDNSMI